MRLAAVSLLAGMFLAALLAVTPGVARARDAGPMDVAVGLHEVGAGATDVTVGVAEGADVPAVLAAVRRIGLVSEEPLVRAGVFRVRPGLRGVGHLADDLRVLPGVAWVEGP
ncbi:MAG: hypothetical protein MUQ56_13350, partial [Thermoleophilia bacterium]|nr:hypothetical protein [Thermoleophilia bacterium]